MQIARPVSAPAAAQAAAAVAVNRAATSAFRQTFGFAVTFAGVLTLAAQAMAHLNGA
ncbi:hypothetical protein [Burkholderia sp. Ac-20379]|uniref:hypothetical protein n=1 Tax=Burkholderia sp. Ac-20379 TaxID=2703900 RepID=UPI00197F0ADA|nr:hypothetical protein [Burkholderia sp. Ac-20379]MBN3726094.1 hypothetical protein [Burkholderia sp. Ac-20379]